MKLAFIALALFAALVWSQDVEVDSGVTVSSAERAIDISSQVVKYVTELHVENGGKAPLNYIVYALSANEDKHLAFIGATGDNKNTALKVSRATLKGAKSDAVLYKIELMSVVAVGGKVTVKVEVVLAQHLKPYPSHITQAEQQFVLYDGNAHILSPYIIKKESTNIVLYHGHVESFTKAEPSKLDGDKLSYGPYENTPAFSTKDIRVHYENNSPFVVITRMERLIEVSHWGNVAIEENIDLLHKGAALKGSFSRLDFQMDRRGNKQPAVKSYKTLLPAASKDVYYRDEIGNISTSNLRQTEEAVELEIRPRFPLYGGWKTNYVIGYNTPSYEYLYSSGGHFALRMRFLDHVFDNAVVEDLTVKIILPEGAKNIKLDPPYKVKRSPDELHYTYLDTTGRPVIIAHKTNLVEAHVQEFTLHYDFDRTGLWREPFIAIIAFYILFVAVIVWVRFDFTIASGIHTSESHLYAFYSI
uniref:Dolichyl-diphosphooligosaccharide--protein glycosyltransferase subunit 1 n=1 Tax=Plectus sambesii TaxID=2011161 RepID=A0A914X1M5_9BILA